MAAATEAGPPMSSHSYLDSSRGSGPVWGTWLVLLVLVALVAVAGWWG